MRLRVPVQEGEAEEVRLRQCAPDQLSPEGMEGLAEVHARAHMLQLPEGAPLALATWADVLRTCSLMRAVTLATQASVLRTCGLMFEDRLSASPGVGYRQPVP